MSEKKLNGKEIVTIAVVIFALVSTSLFVGWHFGIQGFDPFQKSGELSFADLDTTYNVITSDYFEPTSTASIVANGIDGMLGTLNDPYSFYIPKDIYQRLVAEDNGQLIDPGILFLRENGVPVILDIYAGSPAASAGLVAGDKIVSVNGVNVDQLQDTLQLTTALLGQPESTMTVSVLTPDGSTKNVSMTLTNYTTPIVAFKMLDDGIGYLQIYSFDPQFSTDFAPIEKQLKNNNVSKLIIDLRNTPGGDVATEIAFLDKFLNHGTIAREYLGASPKPIVDTAAGNAEFANMKLALIVNNLTASAAEMFTAALQENQRATVVGTTTEGKATEQVYFPLSDGSAVHLTIGRWLTPDGTWIQSKGITPDISVPEVVGSDAPLEKAIDILGTN